MNKYNLIFPDSSMKSNIMRLTNQIWKLIPMRENDEEWIKQLDNVILELVGLNEIFIQCPQFLQALQKLEGLRVDTNIEFSRFRRTVFEVISLIQEMKDS